MTKNPVRLERHLEIGSEGADVLGELSAASGLSHQRLKQAMQKGAVWLGRGRQTRRLRRAKTPLRAGDALHLYYDEAVLAEVPPVPQLIADEGSYSVWCKPYGLRSQGSKWGDHCTINRWVEQHLTPQRPAFIVHRLDRAASGLIIIAHSKKAAAAFSQMFRERAIDKRYRVVVHGLFPEEEVRFDAPIDGRAALSHARRIAVDTQRQRSLLEVAIETGRKHQIRRHLAEAGFPVVGDRLHGNDAGGEDLQLCAWELAFADLDGGGERHYRLDSPPPGCVVPVL